MLVGPLREDLARQLDPDRTGADEEDTIGHDDRRPRPLILVHV